MQLRLVSFYKGYFDNDSSFVNYIQNKNIQFDIFWFMKKKPYSRFSSKSEIIIRELKCIFLLLINIRSFRNKKIVCLEGHYSLLFITKLFGIFLGNDYHLYIYNFYLHELSKKKLIKMILSFLLNSKHTTLIVQSPDEVLYYNTLTKNAVYFISYCEDPVFSMDYSLAPEGNYLFTGGYSNRDYALILKCARLNPLVRFVLVVSRLNKEIKSMELSDNIILFEEIDSPTFNGLMYKSFGVIIPLKENVGASGQMLALGAMKMSKPIIYCNISSINYYFSINNCGIPYKLGDIDSLNNAVGKLFSGEFDIKSMGKRAYKHFSGNFTLNKGNEKLLNLIQKK